MTKKIRKMSKAYAFRFNKAVEVLLLQYCKDHNVNKSDIVQAAVTCYLINSRCAARKNVVMN